MEYIIRVVIGLDVHLGSVENVKVTHVELDVSTSVWNRALSCKNFCHVVILHIGKCFSVVFGSSAAQVMEILDQRENLSVHLHQLNEGHTFTSELLLEVHVEDLGKSCKDNINLRLVKDLQRILVLELKVSLIN